MATDFTVGKLHNFASTEFIACIAAIAIIALLNALIKYRGQKKGGEPELLLAFFHPHCESGGGGERVLWVIIHALLKDKTISNRLRICIYSSVSSRTKLEILAGVNNSFRIDIKDNSEKITFIPIKSSWLLDAKWYLKTSHLCFTSRIIRITCSFFTCKCLGILLQRCFVSLLPQ